MCPWISTQFFARRVCSVTKFAGRAEKRPHCEKLSWTRQDIVTSRTWIRRFGVLRCATLENEEPGIVQVADSKWAEMESERAQKKGCFSCF